MTGICGRSERSITPDTSRVDRPSLNNLFTGDARAVPASQWPEPKPNKKRKVAMSCSAWKSLRQDGLSAQPVTAGLSTAFLSRFRSLESHGRDWKQGTSLT